MKKMNAIKIIYVLLLMAIILLISTITDADIHSNVQTYSGTDADIIYFKNKQTLEGIVKSENDETVIIDVGVGAFSFSRDEIERIERDPALDRSLLKSTSFQTKVSSPEVQELNRLLNVVRMKRRLVARYREELTGVEREMRRIKDDLSDLYEVYEEQSAEESEVDDKGFVSVKAERMTNIRIVNLNVISSKIRNNEIELSDYGEKQNKIGRSLSEALHSLTAATRKLTTQYEDRVREDTARESQPEYQRIKSMIDKFSQEWIHKSIPLQRYGASFLIDVRLNDKKSFPMILDTGASSVCISRPMAQQVGIKPEDEGRTVSVTLANGATVEGRVVYLNSVEVGGMRVEHVQAVILDVTPDSQVQALLGMTYLGNFFFRVDANGKRLILEKLSE